MGFETNEKCDSRRVETPILLCPIFQLENCWNSTLLRQVVHFSRYVDRNVTTQKWLFLVITLGIYTYISPRRYPIPAQKARAMHSWVVRSSVIYASPARNFSKNNSTLGGIWKVFSPSPNSKIRKQEKTKWLGVKKTSWWRGENKFSWNLGWVAFRIFSYWIGSAKS